MAAHSARSARRERRCTPLSERHAASVYRYALAVLGDAATAERLTHATLDRASAALDAGTQPTAPETWLLGIAHALCRKHAMDDGTIEDELARLAAAHDDACPELAPLISRDLDDLLSAETRAYLHRHLRRCEACRSLALGQRAAQAAVRALAALPLPPSLTDRP